MIRTPVHHFDVDVGARGAREACEEIVDQLALEIAHDPHGDLGINHGVRPAAQVNRGHRERLVHGHHEVAGAVDAALVPDRGQHRFAERDADVFDGVMLIDIEIAAGLNLDVESTVTRHQIEHVIEEPDPGIVLKAALAVERQCDSDLCFRRAAIDYSFTQRASNVAAA
jgi:hypothetical protein